MRHLAVLASIACLLCCLSACAGHPRDDVYSRGQITVRFGHVDGIHGRWFVDERTIYLSANPARATLTHELCHACDSLGITLAEAARMVGPTTAPGQDILALVLSQPVSGPDAHWIALGRVCGPQAIGHPHILDRVRSRL